MQTFFTSESVTEGHPDKIADQISDAVLDSILSQDPHGRVACEVLVNTGLVMVAGEITTNCYVDIQKIARKTICDIGYNHGDMHFDGNSCSVLTSIDEQAADIAQGVDEAQNRAQGAGDQGMMFGFATQETDTFMPLPITLAHEVTRQLATVRKDSTLPYLRPDGKAQVTVEYQDGKPTRVHTVVVSAQHAEEIKEGQIREDIKKEVLQPALGEWMDGETIIHVNPTGRFVEGGPQADCGLTGRKIMVDTYGGYARHGGGCFSGKDPSKVDRSAAYMARHIAKSLVAGGFAQKCEVQLSYAIGVAEPVSVLVEAFGTSPHTSEQLEQLVRGSWNLTPKGIIQHLDLLRPIYRQTATYGHFGRSDLNLPWETTQSLKI